MTLAAIIRCFALTLAALLASAPQSAQADDSDLLVISYHDIRDDVAPKGDGDRYAISTSNFVAQIDWLIASGYRPVSLDAVVSASRGQLPLPDKAVLLTFDDGLRSLYTRAFPVLRAYRIPAVAAVVTDWIGMPPETRIAYGVRDFTRDDFATWTQLREMQDSGLVEIASHSANLHTGVPGNPQGNVMPAATTRRYDATSGGYENEAAYLARISDDLRRSRDDIARHLGRAPRALVWPYAAHNPHTNAIANTLGMPITFDLEGRNARIGAQLHGLARLLMVENPGAAELAYELRRDARLNGLRALQVDLDSVYDADPQQQARNLDALVERVKRIGPSHVFLQAFADPDGNGSADALYFPNRHLPMRADLYSRVAWQLKTRAEVQVYAWLPVLGFELPDAQARATLAIRSASPELYRLDFTRPEASRIIGDIYEDLGAAGYFEGLLFHDDAFLRDDELTSLAPGAATERTEALIAFTLSLKAAAQQWRPKLKTVRNLYARTVVEPASEAWFAQRLDRFNQAYDFTAIMAMPWMERSPHPERWMRALTAAVARVDPRFERSLFTLQTVDWRDRQRIPGKVLLEQVRTLQAAGVRHLAWYPDDFIADHPHWEDARAAMSAREFPYVQR
jgi:biofilm PGA synthesis lipoprotein PgaB